MENIESNNIDIVDVRKSFLTIIPSEKNITKTSDMIGYPYLGKKALNGKHVHCHCFNTFMNSIGYSEYITQEPSEAILQAYYLAEEGYASIQNLYHGEDDESKSDMAIVVIPQIHDPLQESYFKKIEKSLLGFGNLVITTGGVQNGEPIYFGEEWIDTRTLKPGELGEKFREMQIHKNIEKEKIYEKKLA